MRKHRKRRTSPAAAAPRRPAAGRDPRTAADPLQALPPRATFFELLEAAVRAARRGDSRLAVLVLDIDRFRELNFSGGQAAGDQVLRELARRLASILRDSDIIARTGDDEFTIVLPGVLGEDHALLAVYRIQGLLETPFLVEELNVVLAASIGVALFPEAGEDGEMLVQAALSAMRKAKETRTGFSVYRRGEAEGRPPIFACERELRRVLEEDALLVHYQPKHDLRTGMICAVEALARLPHAAGRFAEPEAFIHVAEQSGLIHSLTLWILNAALRQLARWHEQGYKLRVSVNLSPINLHDPDFPELVMRALDTWRIAPEYLELEITETAIMQYRAHVIDVLKRLDDIGLSLSIDDFGTGYSSLTYLRRLPVDELKIAKEFVRTMEQDISNELIVRTVIELAHSFGLRVTAEGVEDGETYALLRQLGCDIAQGLYIAPPLPAAALTARLKNETAGAG